MANPLPNSFGFPIQFSTSTNPVSVQNSYGQPAPVQSGRQGDVLISELHGKYYNGTRNGNVFAATANAATGRTILAPGGTTSGFMFYNPVGSGVLMEIIKIRAMPLTATDVVGAIGLEYGAPPTTVTNAVTPVPLLVAGQNLTPLCKASYGSTIVAMTFFQWLNTWIATTGGLSYGGNNEQFFDGLLVLAPGGAVNIVSSTTQSTNLWAQDVTWAEWPI